MQSGSVHLKMWYLQKNRRKTWCVEGRSTAPLAHAKKKAETCNNGLVAHILGNKICSVLGQNCFYEKDARLYFQSCLIRFVRDVLLLASGVKMITKLQVNELR